MANLRTRVIEVAEAALAQRKYVAAVDVFTGLGWLRTAQVDRWRQGQVPTLVQLAAVEEPRLREVVALLAGWARDKGLTAGDATYVTAGRDREPLRFTTSGDDAAFRTHWLSGALTESARQRLVERQAKVPDLQVVVAEDPWRCAECRDTGPYFIMAAAGAQCLTCADLDHLVLLPAGDAALSRRAKKESTLAALVVRHNRRRKRFERTGILIEAAALDRAEAQCLADEDARSRRRDRDRVRRADQDVEFCARMAAEIGRLFPHCPPERAQAIAEHAALRGSGRVGRTAAAKVLDAEAVTLAVIASIRHLDTDYDQLLMRGVPRMDARAAIREPLDRVLESWRG